MRGWTGTWGQWIEALLRKHFAVPRPASLNPDPRDMVSFLWCERMCEAMFRRREDPAGRREDSVDRLRIRNAKLSEWRIFRATLGQLK